MSSTKLCIVFIAVACLIEELTAQRGFYSGSRPQGYKDQYVSQDQTQQLNDRFQGNDPAALTPLGATLTATQRPALPVNAHGDQALIDRLNQLPRDKQPFWFINYQQLEAQRGGQQGGQQLTGGQLNNAQGIDNGLNNRFFGQAPGFINSPFPIVQGVAPTGNFVFP